MRRIFLDTLDVTDVVYQFLVSYLNGQISVVIGERVPT